MRNSIKKYTVAVMAIAAMIATPGCTDSWNDHFGDSLFGSGKSVWELVQEDPDLSTFAGLVKQAHYYRDEKHQSSYTFDQLLDGNRSVTVWAPSNEALANDSNALKEQAKNHPFDFQKQFIMNHVAFGKYNMSQNDTVLRFRLLNAKYATIDPANNLFGTAKVIEKNKAGRNGLLNTVSNQNSYDNNVYEYIKFSTNADLASEQAYIIAHDTIYYKPGSSIEGYPDEYGDPTIIDSVFSATDNLLFGSQGKNSYLPLNYKYNDTYYKYMSYEKMFNININNEDSVYAMLTYTDAALKDGRNKLDKLYKYSLHYPNMERMQSLTTGSSTSEKEFYAENVTLNTVDPDSLADFNEKCMIYATSVFNLNTQPRDYTPAQMAWTPELFAQYQGNYCKYLLNSYGDTLRLDGDKDVDQQLDQSSLFKGSTAHIGSNGVNFVTNTWNYPKSYYDPTLDLNLSTSYRWVEYGQLGTDNYSIESKTLSGDTITKMYDKIGKIIKNDFVVIEANTSGAAADCYFKLRDRTSYGTQIMAPMDKDVSSRRYKVEIVLVPYYLSKGDSIPTSIQDTLSNMQGNKLYATLYYYDPATCASCKFSDMAKTTFRSSSDPYYFSGEKVERITLFEDFEFPVSYRDMIYSYPLLRVQTVKGTSKETRTNPYDKTDKTKYPMYNTNLCIDRIILTPVN